MDDTPPKWSSKDVNNIKDMPPFSDPEDRINMKYYTEYNSYKSPTVILAIAELLDWLYRRILKMAVLISKIELHTKMKLSDSLNSNPKQTIITEVKYSIFLTRFVRLFWPQNHSKPPMKAEKWLLSLSFWIPRKFREYVTGDILEDCNELRQLNFGEWRVRLHVLYHFITAFIMLWPEAIGSIIGTIIKRVLNTKN